ncbi:MAG: hypothetical protein IJZ64_03030, partial [Ruminococcus sp.]|nr:hypothetical protein [Ruminococcus sp.]
ANPDFLGTKAEIAEKAGVTPRTLYRWLRNPDFVAIVNSIVSQYADAELSMVWKALCKRIQDGDIQAIKLYFELRERGLQSKKTDEQSQEKQTSKLYDTLGDENGTDYETVEEAETGDEVGTHAEISE